MVIPLKATYSEYLAPEARTISDLHCLQRLAFLFCSLCLFIIYLFCFCLFCLDISERKKKSRMEIACIGCAVRVTEISYVWCIQILHFALFVAFYGWSVVPFAPAPPPPLSLSLSHMCAREQFSRPSSTRFFFFFQSLIQTFFLSFFLFSSLVRLAIMKILPARTRE